MPNNVAVLVGSNYVGTPNELGGCANDVRDMGERLKNAGFTTTTLTDVKNLKYSTGGKVTVAAKPTKVNIMSYLNNMIKGAKAGDTLVFYYSGHGTQIPSAQGSDQDFIVSLDAVTNGFDQSKLISSDELHNALIAVPQGVKLLMVADSCFSGNITHFDNTARGLKSKIEQTIPFQHLSNLIKGGTRSRSLNSHGALTLIAGCKDNQESTDLGTNGALTAAIKEWIAKNTLSKWLETCFTYVGDALSKFKAAITKTIKDQKITDQDPQISFDKDTGQVAPTVQPVPAPTTAPVVTPVPTPVVAPPVATPVAPTPHLSFGQQQFEELLNFFQHAFDRHQRETTADAALFSQPTLINKAKSQVNVGAAAKNDQDLTESVGKRPKVRQ
jgi:hypothetical protein